MTTVQLWEHFFCHLRIMCRARTPLLCYGVTRRTLERYVSQDLSCPDDLALGR